MMADDERFMLKAREAALLATCDRKHVGAVLVTKSRLWAPSTGSNRSLTGLPSCDDAGHDMYEGHCVRTVHAEINALTRAAADFNVVGCTMYVTAYPCWQCFKVLASAGVSRIVYDEAYRPDERVAEAARVLGVAVVKHDATP